MTQKIYPQNLHTPKNIHFSENSKNIGIQNFEPQKMTRAYVCMKISKYPLGPAHPCILVRTFVFSHVLRKEVKIVKVMLQKIGVHICLNGGFMYRNAIHVCRHPSLRPFSSNLIGWRKRLTPCLLIFACIFGICCFLFKINFIEKLSGIPSRCTANLDRDQARRFVSKLFAKCISRRH